MPREQWESCVATDVFGFFNIIQAALPYLRKTQGSIVALSTAATQTYAPLDILSAGPKGSLEQLVKAVGREEGKNGVRANGVRVGHIDAGQGVEIQDDPRGKRLAERVVAGTPLRRLGTADDISNAVIYFASSMASYVTGEFIAVDGGGHI
jgi:NAD(P)-dependent dehydrogenase (short-subunit alcohol dehydrogenase family)